LHDFYFNQVNPKDWHDIDEKYVFNLYKKISETIDEISIEGKNEKEKLEVRYIEDYRDANPRLLLEKISELLGANFGLTLVLAGEPRK
jgi:hypothetical protein